MSWNLEWYQEQAFLCRVSIFQPSAGPDPVTGIWPDDITVTRLAAAVPVRYGYTLNDSDPQPGLGRVKRRNMLTEDHLFLPLLAPVEDCCWVRDETLIPDANGALQPSENYGSVHRVMGAPQKLDNLGGATPNLKFVQIMEDEHAQEILTQHGFPFP